MFILPQIQYFIAVCSDQMGLCCFEMYRKTLTGTTVQSNSTKKKKLKQNQAN